MQKWHNITDLMQVLKILLAIRSFECYLDI